MNRSCQPHPHPLPQRGGVFALIPIRKIGERMPPSPLGEGMGVGLAQTARFIKNKAMEQKQLTTMKRPQTVALFYKRY